MNRREDPREPTEPRTRPIPRQPQPPRGPQPPRQPSQPPEQPWYLEFRRPPAPIPPPPRPAPPPPKPAEPQHPSKPALLIAAAVTGLLAVAVLLTLVLRGVVGDTGPVELDVLQAQDGVRQVLTDPINGYGRDKVTDVRCNNGVNPIVRKGSSFTCAVTVDGRQRQVLVEFADDAGTYEVDRPR